MAVAVEIAGTTPADKEPELHAALSDTSRSPCPSVPVPSCCLGGPAKLACEGHHAGSQTRQVLGSRTIRSSLISLCVVVNAQTSSRRCRGLILNAVRRVFVGGQDGSHVRRDTLQGVNEALGSFRQGHALVRVGLKESPDDVLHCVYQLGIFILVFLDVPDDCVRVEALDEWRGSDWSIRVEVLGELPDLLLIQFGQEGKTDTKRQDVNALIVVRVRIFGG
mmetsp:Transcript_50254/g.98959  ORF Transcript_50254/g.98959 Transcript_50254/m.98959 type:complete len:221 (+) Transcript_50254:1369-2031(+)